jgi:uncharacterized protein YqgV (UPF0045/DUF77 family)
MKIAVDISLYPFDPDFVPPISDVIERLNAHENLEIWTNAMSTQIVGEFEDVWNALGQEIGTTFASIPKGVFIMKVLNNPGQR